jgi:hypothetical protein
MKFPKDFHHLNFLNHGLINSVPELGRRKILLKHIPPFSKRSCISIVQFASSQFSSIAPKKSSSNMPVSFVARLIPPSPAPISTPCMSISISGVAPSIVNGLSLLRQQSVASGGCGKRNEIYT